MSEYFRSVIFKTDDELVCQNRKGVFMITIRESKNMRPSSMGAASDGRLGTMFERSSMRTSYNSAATSVYEEQDDDIEQVHLELIYEEVYFIKTFSRELGTQ